jgi:hypothetical protein
MRPPPTEKPGCGDPGCLLHGDATLLERKPRVAELAVVALLVGLLVAAWLIARLP